MTVGLSKMAIFARYVAISRIGCILETKLLQDLNRKPFASYLMVSHSMNMKIKWVLLQFRCSPNDRKLLALSLVLAYAQKQTSRNLNCDSRHKLTITDILKAYFTFRFASIARVLSALLNFLFFYSETIVCHNIPDTQTEINC